MPDHDGYLALSPGASPTQDGDHYQHPPLSLKSGRGTFTLHSDGKSYTYNYGPRGLPGLLHNSYALLCAFFASLGGLTFGYDQGVIANVLVMDDFIQRWPVTPLQKGMMTAVLELGALFGALYAGRLADSYSRRHSILFACVIFSVGSAFQGGAQSLTHIFIGRAIGGIGVGALSMLSPLYMAEISPPELRGSLMALEQFSIVVGVVFGFWAGFLTRSIPSAASWRIPLGVQIIPGFILGIGCLFLPPSPRFLVLKGRDEDALASLAKLRLRTEEEALDDPLLRIELLEMKVETALIQLVSRTNPLNSSRPRFWNVCEEVNSWRPLFQKKYRDRTMVAIMIMVFQQWSGINALLYYGPTIVQNIGFRGDTVTLLVSGGIGIVQFFAVIPAILYIDTWGRKPLLRWGSAVMAVCHLLIAFLVYRYHDDWASHSLAARAAVSGIYLFTAAYGISIGPIGWVLPSEVFPLSIRSKGVAVSTASNWLNNFLIGLLTPVLMDMSAAATFMIFALSCFSSYFWSTFYVPETANVSLEEIDAVFGSKAGSEDERLKLRIEEEMGLRRLIRELAGLDMDPNEA